MQRGIEPGLEVFRATGAEGWWDAAVDEVGKKRREFIDQNV